MPAWDDSCKSLGKTAWMIAQDFPWDIHKCSHYIKYYLDGHRTDSWSSFLSQQQQCFREGSRERLKIQPAFTKWQPFGTGFFQACHFSLQVSWNFFLPGLPTHESTRNQFRKLLSLYDPGVQGCGSGISIPPLLCTDSCYPKWIKLIVFSSANGCRDVIFSTVHLIAERPRVWMHNRNCRKMNNVWLVYGLIYCSDEFLFCDLSGSNSEHENVVWLRT